VYEPQVLGHWRTQRRRKICWIFARSLATVDPYVMIKLLFIFSILIGSYFYFEDDETEITIFGDDATLNE
jgi:hypothetical protein